MIYCAGLMFNQMGNEVALICKTKPEWQKGMWNAIGGKREEKDITTLHAQIREFEEETGVLHTDWIEVITLHNSKNDYSLSFFAAFTDDVYKVQTITEEKVQLFDVVNLTPKLAPNVRWIIQMILHISDDIEFPIILHDKGGH